MQDTEYLSNITALIGGDAVRTQPNQIAPYLLDWRGRYKGSALAVLLPDSTQAIASIIKLSAQAGVAIVPQGGNTSLCGGATPLNHGRSVVLSLERLCAIRHLNLSDAAITVEAGCTLAQVQTAAEAAGAYFPLSLAAQGSCQIGGNISNNAGGVHVLRYGMMRDLVLGLEVVLPDGQIWNGLKALRKDNTGYALKHLFIGAEGTLGVITAAQLKLFPQPQARAAAWVAVPHPQAAIDLLGYMRQICGERIEAFELMGEVALSLVRKHQPELVVPLVETAPWAVLVELADVWAQAPLEELLTQTLAHAVEAGWVLDAVLATQKAHQSTFWAIREAIPEAQKQEGISIKHDIGVPISQLPNFLEQANTSLQTAFPGLRITVFGHVGDGNLHYNLSHPDPAKQTALLAQSEYANTLVYDLVDSLSGTFSAEHGIGQLKIDTLAHYKPPVEMALMAQIKSMIDPLGIMNPGKILASPSLK